MPRNQIQEASQDAEKGPLDCGNKWPVFFTSCKSCGSQCASCGFESMQLEDLKNSDNRAAKPAVTLRTPISKFEMLLVTNYLLCSLSGLEDGLWLRAWATVWPSAAMSSLPLLTCHTRHGYHHIMLYLPSKSMAFFPLHPLLKNS